MQVVNIRAEHNRGMHRVCADVEGDQLWFESSDIKLRPSPEAFGCALLLPALFHGSQLVVEGSASPIWMSNIEHLLDIVHEWWDYPKLMPRMAVGPTEPATLTGRSALCFSGGVDSFYTLLRSNQTIDLLVTLHGYDIKLQDITRMEAFRSSLSSISKTIGVKSAIIRTNLREHAAVKEAPWDHAHGGALAAIGHMLGDSIDRLLISSSYHYGNDKPWGSHWRIDPFWSSNGLQIVHTGADVPRSDKLQAIAKEPLVRQHLRVCWQNLLPQGNCSRCEKCLRARIVLTECGELDNFPVFEGEETLVRHINGLSFIHGFGGGFRKALERGNLEPGVEKAVRKLMKRTRRAKSLPMYLAKKTFQRVFHGRATK